MQKGFQDGRAQAFWHGLRTIYLLQCQAAIFECVPGAGSHPEVREGLLALAKLMEWEILETKLRLSDQWPCARHRWWAILLPKCWCTVGLEPWPKDTKYHRIHDILKEWGAWTEPEENELQLTCIELDAYTDPALGRDPRLLGLHDQARTFLHSYGSAFVACPCGCRSEGFPRSLLEQKGLRGCFIKSTVSGAPRYLHPREVGLLLGVPATVRMDQACKENLALLGLVASPLQSVWIYTTLVRNAAGYIPELVKLDPLQTLRGLQDLLVEGAAEQFGQAITTTPLMIELQAPDATKLILVAPQATTAASLLSAERHKATINNSQGQVAVNDYLTDSGPYLLEHPPKRQRREGPTGVLVIGIQHKEEFLISFIKPGTFLFEALRENHIQHINYLIDEDGRIYGADFKAWRSLRLRTISRNQFPHPAKIHLAGHGMTKNDTNGLEGLTVDTLHDAAKSMLRTFSHMGHSFTLFNTYDLLRYPREPRTPTSIELALRHHKVGGFFLANGHWAVLTGDLDAGTWHWKYYDGLDHRLMKQAKKLALRLTITSGRKWGSFETVQHIPQAEDHTCGTVALAHLCSHLGFPGVFSNHSIRSLHNWLARPRQATGVDQTAHFERGATHSCS